MDNIKLKPEHSAKIRALRERETAMQRFVEQVVAQGERRGQELLAEGQAFWASIEGEYNLDLKHQSWAPNADATELKLIAARFD